jgi:ectoine hydroxylase
MKLSAEQLKAFDEQGYVFFPNCFSEDEIYLLRAEADNILKLDALLNEMRAQRANQADA